MSRTAKITPVTINRRDVLKVLAGVPAATALTGAATLPARAGAEAKPPTKFIDVSVATSWVEPGRNRPVDEPSMTNPANPLAWMDAMTLADRLWLIGELETQASYGNAVRVLKTSGDWSYVAVVGQPTPRNKLGYPGWIPTAQLRSNDEFRKVQASNPFAMVTADTAQLFADPLFYHPDLELSFNTRLPVVKTRRDAIGVMVPSGRTRWFSHHDVTVYNSVDDIPAPTGADLEATGMRFLGLRYLWAGVSAYGFDCSGFTSTVYSSHGITIPRDAGPQHDAGTKVDGAGTPNHANLQTGDLIFFARPGESIHHVGMYADGDIIDAPSNSATEESPLERVKLEEHRYISEYVGAVRYL